MFAFTFLFLLGDLYLQTFAHLPTKQSLFLLVLSGSFAWILLGRYRYAYLPSAFLFGFVLSAWYAHSLLSFTLPNELEGKPIVLKGFIASLPTKDQWQTQFLFSLQQIQHGNKRFDVKTLIRLSWRDNKTHLRVGDGWQLVARIKRIHGTQNQGAFDYEAWALQKGLRATGYVVSGNPANKFLTHHWYYHPIDQIRQVVGNKIRLRLPDSLTSPWLLALTIGERSGISQSSWQVLRNTGTNHLMAIAGLHIGIMAGFAHWLCAWIWRRFPWLLLRLPASHAGAYAALCIALFYSALAGFSIPTQRASIMLIIFILTLLSKRKINVWHSWSFALLMVLLINPLTVLTESFWLSFGTIALIIYGMKGRLAAKGFWWHWGRVQWVIAVGLIPLSLFFFRECSIVSFVANSIAIPWLGFFILPFCFLSILFLFISPPIATVLLACADKSLGLLWIVLTWFSKLHFATWHLFIPNHGILIITMFAFIFLLLPSGFPGRWLAFFWLLPIIFYKPPKPTLGDFWLTLLDVGQGLAVVVQTKTHLLVYDAGPKYLASSDMGERIVLPYLETIGANQIDLLVISHGDNDHSGGAQAILNALPVRKLKTSVPEKFLAQPASYCLSGESWQWDNVQFKFIYPSVDKLKLNNNSSCVLTIDNGSQRVLLTGDIEKLAERTLLLNNPSELSAHLLIAPHHGSKTSGLETFVTAVHPNIVLYAVGYRNRYHFPHYSVVKAYARIHAQQLSTSDSGAIHFKFQKGDGIYQEEYRKHPKKYWYPIDK